MTYTITPEDIEKVKQAGACKPLIAWLSQESRTLEDLIGHELSWFWWVIGQFSEFADKLPSETLDYCARRGPEAALQYAADKLSPESLDHYAQQEPPTEPVAWRVRDYGDGWIYTEEKPTDYIAETGAYAEPLFTHPAGQKVKKDEQKKNPLLNVFRKNVPSIQLRAVSYGPEAKHQEKATMCLMVLSGLREGDGSRTVGLPSTFMGLT